MDKVLLFCCAICSCSSIHLGTRPVRRCWERWPLTFLEPEGMNKEEEIQKNVSKGNGEILIQI